MSDWTQPVRQQAVIALGKLGPMAARALPLIEQRLRDGEFRPAANAAKTLWLLKPESDLPSRILLVELASGDDPSVAVEVLGEVGIEMGAADEVAELLKLKYRWARLYAAEALGKMGPDAAPIACPALEAALDDEDKEVREAVEEALRKIAPTDQKPP
jgi:HEAT repeat protein